MNGKAELWEAKFCTEIDWPWTKMEPIKLGTIPTGMATPYRFITVEFECTPKLRVDLHFSDAQCFAFEEICFWHAWIVIGCGECVFLVNRETCAAQTHALGSYFGHIYADDDYLLVASGEELFRIDENGGLLWRSPCLGIDGVVVHGVRDGVIYGEGEWDPPGGWRPFELRLENGTMA